MLLLLALMLKSCLVVTVRKDILTAHCILQQAVIHILCFSFTLSATFAQFGLRSTEISLR